MKRGDIQYQSHWGNYILEREDLSLAIKCKMKDHGIDFMLTIVWGESIRNLETIDFILVTLS